MRQLAKFQKRNPITESGMVLLRNKLFPPRTKSRRGLCSESNFDKAYKFKGKSRWNCSQGCHPTLPSRA
jgi:hypothetical protein